MGNPLRVLLIEDSEDDAQLLLRELERGGFDPVWERAQTAAETRAALHKPWDVILADYRLPGFGALEALQILDESGRDLPLILVSGSIGEETAVEAMRAGACDYVMKGRPSRLVPAVRRELREAAGRRARHQTEQALRESEERYRSLVESTSDLITMGTADGTILFQSPSVERVLGYRPDQMIGRNWGEFVHPQDVPLLREAIQNVIHGSAFAMSEVRVRHRDGSYRVLEVLSTLKTSHRGETTVLGTARDITDRKLLEDQLRQSQKMEAVGRLAGGVAHDFNNLLTAIMGYSEWLREQLTGQPGPLENVEQIAKAAERAAELTRQLLAFSRRQVLSPQVLDLNAVISRMEGMLRRVIGERIRLVTRLGKEVGAVRADPSQIEQVVMNLAINGRDAMPDGGSLTLKTANFTARPGHSGALPPGDYVMLTVEDTGHGIDDETRRHLFEPFYTTKERSKGTGLGLSAVYGAVGQSGGTIQVDSAPGRGTRFSLYLPRADEPADVPAGTARVVGGKAKPASTAARSAGSETILLVEDEDSVRTLIHGVLESRGYSVLEARDGDEGLAAIERHAGKVDLLLTDVVMPAMSGQELLRLAATLRPEIRVLYMTGYAEAGTGDLADLGDRLLHKPFTPEALIRSVEQALAAEAVRATVAGPRRSS